MLLCIVQAGEVWYEVAGELAQEGLRPVTPDQECLTEILHTHEEKAEECLKLQVYKSQARLIPCFSSGILTKSNQENPNFVPKFSNGF